MCTHRVVELGVGRHILEQQRRLHLPHPIRSTTVTISHLYGIYIMYIMYIHDIDIACAEDRPRIPTTFTQWGPKIHVRYTDLICIQIII